MIVNIGRLQKMFVNLKPTPKIAPTGQKKLPRKAQKVQKWPQIWLTSKQKDRAVLPKPKLIVNIGRLQKMFF